MASSIPDTALGATIRRRLESEVVVWLTTVGADGTPHPNPVWFLWDGDTLLVYNRPTAGRVSHVRDRPRVGLNFDGDGRGGAIAVIAGDAEIAEDAPAAPDHPAYLAKYSEHIARIGHDAASFARDYPVAIRIRPTRFRGH